MTNKIVPDENTWTDEDAREIDAFWNVNLHEIAIHSIEAMVCMHYLRPGESTLEVGCGTGRLYDKFVMTPRLGAYTGVDKSPSMLSIFKKRCPTLPLFIGDAMALPFKDGAFDLVTCCEVIRHLKPWQQVILELHRVAKRIAMFSLDLTDGPARLVGEDRKGSYLANTEGYTHYQIEHNPSEVLDWIFRTIPCGVCIRTISGSKWIIVLQKDLPPGTFSIQPVMAMNSVVEEFVKVMSILGKKIRTELDAKMGIQFTGIARLDTPTYVKFNLEVITDNGADKGRGEGDAGSPAPNTETRD